MEGFLPADYFIPQGSIFYCSSSTYMCCVLSLTPGSHRHNGKPTWDLLSHFLIVSTHIVSASDSPRMLENTRYYKVLSVGAPSSHVSEYSAKEVKKKNNESQDIQRLDDTQEKVEIYMIHTLHRVSCYKIPSIRFELFPRIL